MSQKEFRSADVSLAKAVPSDQNHSHRVITQQPWNVALYQPQSARLNGQYSILKGNKMDESHTESFINQNNASFASGKHPNLYANKESEEVQRGGARHSLLSNQDDRVSRRSVSSCWYSNRQNDFDWVDLAPSDIKSVVITPEFYMVNVDGDLEDGVINKSVIDPSVSELGHLTAGGRQFDIYNRSVKAVAPLQPETKLMALNGRILNSEDLRRMVGDEYIDDTDSCLEAPFRVYGYNEHRDEIFGFDQFGNTILAFEEKTLRPVFGYLAGSKKPIYGLDQHGHQIIDFDQDRRPVFGYTEKRIPVNFIDRNHLQAYWRDERNQPILGYTDDKKPIFGVLPNGVKALAYDPESKKPIYAFETNGRPLFEEEILFRSQEPIGFGATGEAVYNDDLHNGPVYGYTREGRPVYGFDEQGNQVLGFGPADAFIYGSEENGRPVYGYTKEGKPVSYFERNSDTVLFSKDGKPLPNINKQLFDKSKREIPIRGTISPKTQPDKPTSPQKETSKLFEMFDPQGEPLTNPQSLYDSAGLPIPSPATLTNIDGKILDAKSPIRDHTGELIKNPLHFKATSSNPDDLLANARVNKEGFLFSNSGVLLGMCDENGVVRNQSGGMVTIKGKVIKKQDGGFASARILSPRDLNPQRGTPLGIYKSDYLTKDDIYYRNMSNRHTSDDKESSLNDPSVITQRNRFKSLTLTNEVVANNASGIKTGINLGSLVSGKEGQLNPFGKEDNETFKEKKVSTTMAEISQVNGQGLPKTGEVKAGNQKPEEIQSVAKEGSLIHNFGPVIGSGEGQGRSSTEAQDRPGQSVTALTRSRVRDGKVIDENGAEIGTVTTDGRIIDKFGAVIGSVDREGRLVPELSSSFSSSTRVLQSSFVGNINYGDQSHLTFGDTSLTQELSSIGKTEVHRNEEGSALAEKKKGKQQKADQKEKKSAEKKSMQEIKETKAEGDGPVTLEPLLSADSKAEKLMLQDSKKVQAELAKSLINEEGQVIDSEGNIIGTVSKEGRVLNEKGELIGEVGKDGSIAPVRSSLFGLQMTHGAVVDEQGRVLATVKENNILGYDGQLVATIDKTGQIFTVEGQEIDSTGWLLDLKGGRVAKFELRSLEDDLITLPKSNFPALFDAKGQRIIGFNKRGTVAVTQMNDGRAVLGVSEEGKGSRRSVAWDSEQKAMTEAQVKNLIKLAARTQNLEYESSEEEEGLLYEPDDGGLDLEEELRQIGQHKDQYFERKTSNLVKSNLKLKLANIQDLKYSIKKPQSMGVQSIDQKHLKMGLKLTVGEKFDPLEAQRLLEEKKKGLLDTKKKKKTKEGSEADPSKPKKRKKVVEEEGAEGVVKPKKKKVKEGEMPEEGVVKKKKKKVVVEEKQEEIMNKSNEEAVEVTEIEKVKPKKKKKAEIEVEGEVAEAAPKKKKVVKKSEQLKEENEVDLGAQQETETKKPIKKTKKTVAFASGPDPQGINEEKGPAEEANKEGKEIKKKKKVVDGKKGEEPVVAEVSPKAQKKDKLKASGDSVAKKTVSKEPEAEIEEKKVKSDLKKKPASEGVEGSGKGNEPKKLAPDAKPTKAPIKKPTEDPAQIDRTKNPTEVSEANKKVLKKAPIGGKNEVDEKVVKKTKLPEESKLSVDPPVPGKTSIEAILKEPGVKKESLAKIENKGTTKAGEKVAAAATVEVKGAKLKKGK
jgi:hypothetical protein